TWRERAAHRTPQLPGGEKLQVIGLGGTALSSVTCQQRVTLSALSPKRSYSTAMKSTKLHTEGSTPRRDGITTCTSHRAAPIRMRHRQGCRPDCRRKRVHLATYSGALPLTTHAVAAYDLGPSSSPSR